MLIKRNRTNKEKSEYECDMCKSEINGLNRISLFVKIGKSTTSAPKKKWDLCPKCYKIINKNITIWSERRHR